jgi:hypothetical protein
MPKDERDTKYAKFAKVLWNELANDATLSDMMMVYIDSDDPESPDANDLKEFEKSMVLVIARKLYEWREHGWDKPGWPENA